MLGGAYGIFAKPKYIGTLVINPARIANTLVINLDSFFSQMKINSFYSDQVLLACSPDIKKSEIERIKIFKIINPRVDSSSKLLTFSLEGRDKFKIINCLNLLEDEIAKKQREIAIEYIEKNKKKIILLQKESQLKEEIIVELTKTIEKKEKLSDKEQINLNEISPNPIINLDLLIKIYQANIVEIHKNLMELSSQLNESQRIIPIDIQQKKFPAVDLGLILGLILGFSIGCIISILNIAIKIKDKK